MIKSLKKRDYQVCELSGYKRLFYILQASLLVVLLAYFFYRSFFAIPPLCVAGYFFYRTKQQKKASRDRDILADQFRECLLSVSTALQAGYAVENAFLESRNEMKSLYGEQSMIYYELEIMRRGMVINITLEDLLMDFADRSGVEEIRQFARIFRIAKRSGGNLPEMIRNYAFFEGEIAQTKQEVDLILVEKKMEQGIMKAVPFLMIAYINRAYPGFFDSLYHNLQGVAIMSVCLMVYLLAVVLGDKILENISRQLAGTLLIKPLKPPEVFPNGILKVLQDFFRKLYRQICRKWGLLPTVGKVKKDLELLFPGFRHNELLENYFTKKCTVSFLIAIIGLLFGFLLQLKSGTQEADNKGLLLLCLFEGAAIAVFFLTDRDLHEKVLEKRKRWKYQYPDITHKLVLYLGAGLSIRSSFYKLAEQYEPAQYACREMDSGIPEVTAYEHFGKRTGLLEYVRLATLLIQSLKRGNAALFDRLDEEAERSSRERVQNAKRLGEEAGTKLLIPMVMILAVVMVMIMIPAFSGL